MLQSKAVPPGASLPQVSSTPAMAVVQPEDVLGSDNGSGRASSEAIYPVGGNYAKSESVCCATPDVAKVDTVGIATKQGTYLGKAPQCSGVVSGSLDVAASDAQEAVEAPVPSAAAAQRVERKNRCVLQ